MPHLALQRMLLPGVDVKTMNSGKVKSGLGKEASAENGYDALATYIVPSGGVASVSFSGIPNGYSHIEVRSVLRLTRATGTDDLKINFNGDTGNNYSTHLAGVVNTGSTPYTYYGTSGNLVFHYEGFPAATQTADVFAGAIWTINDYAKTNKYKTMRAIHGFDSNGGEKSLFQMVSGGYRSLNAIHTITFAPIYGSGIAEHSHFALYGVK